MRMECDVIRDLLPLYVDDVVSDATRQLVEEHLAECESCRGEEAEMREHIQIPVNADVRMDETKSLKGLKRMLANWKLKNAVVSIIAIMLMIVFTVLFLMNKTNTIVYDGTNIEFSQHKDGYYISYNSKGTIAWNANGDPDTGEWRISFSQTLWDKYIHPLYSNRASVYYFCEIGDVTKLITYDGTVIWEADEEEKALYFEKLEQMKKEGQLG